MLDRGAIEADLLGVNRYFTINQEVYRKATLAQIGVIASIIGLRKDKHYDKYKAKGSLNFDITPYLRSEGVFYRAKVEYSIYR